MATSRLAIAGLLVLSIVLALHAARRESPTFDEPAHLAAGVVNLVEGDYRLLPQSPPLPHLIAALPVVAGGVSLPPKDLQEWRESDAYGYSVLMMYGPGNDAEAMIRRARVAMALLLAPLGLLVWWWGRSLWGEGGGLLSLALFTFSPALLGNGPLVAADTISALGFLLAVTAWWRHLTRVSLTSALASAAAAGFLFLSKHSAVLLIPTASLLVLIALIGNMGVAVFLPGRKPRAVSSRGGRCAVWAASAAVQALLVGIMIWAAYGFRGSMVAAEDAADVRYPTPGDPLPPDQAWSQETRRAGTMGKVVRIARELHLLPESYLYGLAYTFDATRYHTAYLFGEQRLDGWWYYFPVVFGMKTPLPMLALLLLAALPTGRGRPAASVVAADPEGHAAHVDDAPMQRPEARAAAAWQAAPLWALLVVYTAAAMYAHLSIGHRHLLPIYPVLFILAGRAALSTADLPWRRWKGTIAWTLAAMLAVVTLAAHPHYLAFFNLFAGGSSRAYRHVVDSSLDWGQDLPALKRWLDDHAGPTGREAGPTRDAPADSSPPLPPVYLAYFGTALPPRHGINARRLPGTLSWAPPEYRPLEPGIYCISATLFQQVTLLPSSRWTPSMEAAYRLLVEMSGTGGLVRESFLAPASAPGRLSAGDLLLLDRLRFARLCAHLRARDPDGFAGYSILIFRVDENDIRAALGGEPPESAAESPTLLRHLAERSYAMGGPIAAGVFFDRYLQAAGISGDPDTVDTIVKCGNALMGSGRRARAIEVLRAGAAVAPDDAPLLHALAWLLATSPEESLRDGADAVSLAERAHQLTGGNDPSILDALAATYAEVGRFDDAIATATRAIEIARATGRLDLIPGITERLNLYRQHQPCRVGHAHPSH